MSYSECFQVPTFYCNSCPTPLKGNIYAVAVTLRAATKQTSFDPTSTQDWYNLVCNNLARIIPNVRGTYDGSTAVEGPGYGSLSTRTIGRNHQLTYNQLFQCENIDFYNQIQSSNLFEFWWLVGETQLFRSGSAANIFAQMPVTEDVSSDVEFAVTVKFANPYLSECYDVPPTIFDSCEALTAIAGCLTCETVPIYPC